MKVKEQSKQKVSVMSKVKLRPRLLAFTMGVSLCFTKTPVTKAVSADKLRAILASVLPKGSS